MARKNIPAAVQAKVVTECARRCALCFGLKGDLLIKQGQIAHINRDHSDAREGNLAFLCFDHHDAFDSSTSQSKSFLPHELLKYKASLIDAITKGQHTSSYSETSTAATREHDLKIFQESDAMLAERVLNGFLDTLAGDNSYHRLGAEPLDRLFNYSVLTGSAFLHPELRERQAALVGALGELRHFLSVHFFVYPSHQTVSNTRYCLYPEQNIDRGGDGSPRSMAHYEKHRAALEKLVMRVERAYKSYREAIKRVLMV